MDNQCFGFKNTNMDRPYEEFATYFFTPSISITSGVDYSGRSLNLDNENDAQPIIEAINRCPDLQYLTLTGNTLGVSAAQAIAKALERHPELKRARFNNIFTGRIQTEIPPVLTALGDGMSEAGTRLKGLNLSENALRPIGAEGVAKLLQNDACSQLQELYLHNNGLGITGGRLLAKALSTNLIHLRVFVAGRNRLEDEGAKALAGVFQSMGTLEEVSMPQNDISPAGITALAEAFQQNPRLVYLDLDGNTMGPKGAAAIAAALPSLDRLKLIYFGNCLLKSKGANILAKSLKDIEYRLWKIVDLSHNGIGREACMEVVDALTSLPRSAERLPRRVVLAGNRLGGAKSRKAMKDKLGSRVELGDEEGNEDEYVLSDDEEDEDEEDDSQSDTSESDDEEEEDEEDESQSGEDSATQDVQDPEIVTNKGGETSLDQSAEMDPNVGSFLSNPTIENLMKLGENPADVLDAHLQLIPDQEAMTVAYVKALCCMSGLSGESATAAENSSRFYQTVVKRARPLWVLADTLLRALTLIKSDNKDFKIRWRVPACYSALAAEIDAPYFPAPLRDTLKFSVASKMTALPAEVRSVIYKHPNLYTLSCCCD